MTLFLVGMRQKVVIRAVVYHHDRILLIRRHGGRQSIAGKYELPGGSLHAGEQPVDALKRSLQIHVGIEPGSYKLRDVVSFIDPDDRNLQYLFIIFSVRLPLGSPRVTLDDEYDRYRFRDLNDIPIGAVTNSTAILLGLGGNLEEHPDLIKDKNKLTDKIPVFIIHSDGGSRGNPGPSASAYIITDKDGNLIEQGGKFLGVSDSGMAEYLAVEMALKKAIELGAQHVEYYSDSLMVVNQINGLFKVKNEEFRDVHDRIIKLLFNFKRIIFRHIHREYNSLADSLVNRILDENLENIKK